MRVFVAGAAGAIGLPLVRRLAAAGHSVVGLICSAAKVGPIAAAGGAPVVADALNRAAIVAAVADARPDAIVHELTALGAASDLVHFNRTFAVANRLRTEGLESLLAGARRAGTRRLVAQSFCGWPFAREGGPVKAEDAPLDPDPPRELRRSLTAIRHLEDCTTAAPEIDGVVLRYGAFFGPATGMSDATFIDALRRRVPLVGGGGGWWSFLRIDDAAAATVLAIDGAPPGIYNIADGEPAALRDRLPTLAALLGAKPPRRIPRWLARVAAGRHMAILMTETRAGSNAKTKRRLVWRPAHPSRRRGFAEAAAQG